MFITVHSLQVIFFFLMNHWMIGLFYVCTEREMTEVNDQRDAIQKKLDKTGEMISDLQKTQHQRLSQKLPSHLAMVPGPSEKETKLGKTSDDNTHLSSLFVAALLPQFHFTNNGIRLLLLLFVLI